MTLLNRSKAIILSVILSGFAGAAFAQSTSVTAAVDFGHPPEGGGTCSGKGICSATPPFTDPTTAVNVTFSLSSTDENILLLTFSRLELNQKQPDQAQYINSVSTTYNFEAPFYLNASMFAPLGLPQNAAILPSLNNTLSISAGVVTIAVPYYHN